MKKMIFLIVGLLVIQTSILPIQGYSNITKVKTIQSNRTIRLTGKFIVRFGVKKHIVVYQNDSDLELIFKNTMGNLNISIIKSSGSTVYQRTENAVEGGVLIIDTFGWNEGNYIIRIADKTGISIEGIFKINIKP